MSGRMRDRIPVGILGGTGLVGRRLARELTTHGRFCLGPVAGSPATVGKLLRDVWIAKEAKLQGHYRFWIPEPCPESLAEVIVASTEALRGVKYVISAVAPKLGHIEESLRDAGVVVFSISPHARMANPLIVPEVNGITALAKEIEKRRRQKVWPLFKNPNCVVCGASIALAALESTFGSLQDLHIVTFQAVSGRGDAVYDPVTRVMNNILPLAGTDENTDAYQRSEFRRLFPSLATCSVFAHRVPVMNGHYVRIACNLRSRPSSPVDIEAAFHNFRPLHDYDLISAPTTPIIVCNDVGRPAPAYDTGHSNGMAIAVGDIRLGKDDHQETFDVSFGLVVNNIVRGAWGGALLTAELFDRLVK